jgi:hypothetical protein
MNTSQKYCIHCLGFVLFLFVRVRVKALRISMWILFVLPTKEVRILVMLLNCIWEVLSLNLCLDASCHNRVFVVFLTPSKKLPGLYLDYITTDAFQLFFDSYVILSFDASLWQQHKVTHKRNYSFQLLELLYYIDLLCFATEVPAWFVFLSPGFI